MPSILGANTLSSAYDVANSARFDGAYHLVRSKGASETGLTKGTFSLWVKRTNIDGEQHLLYSNTVADTNNRGYFSWRADEKLRILTTTNNSSELVLESTQLFRDPSAWYHIVYSIDTTQSTAANRCILYINGTRVTAFDTAQYMDQNSQCDIFEGGQTNKEYIGGMTGNTSNLHSYLAEYVYIDGLALAADKFGKFDSGSPTVWKPIDVSGLTFGNNGFYLNFQTSAELGDDVSGNTNDFAESNLTAVDQSTDTCTNNFATLNPLDSFSSGAAFSGGNTTVQSTTSNRGIMAGTFGLSKGKWYWEVKTSASAGTHSSDEWNFIGVSNSPASNTDNILGLSGTNSNKLYEYAIQGYDGNKHNNGDQGGYAASFTTNDIIGVYLDLDNNRIYWSKNGSWADGSGNSDENDPNGYVSMTDPASTPGGFYFPACGDGGSNVNKTWQWNFGGTPGFAISSGNADPNGYGNFEYPTEGAYAICSKNLAEYG